MQGQNAVNERGILRGVEALILVSCQSGRRDLASLRQIARIAEQVELRRAEHHRQHQTAGRKPAPAAAEDEDGLLQEHFPGKIAHERADRQKQQHVPEIIRRVAREQLDQQHTDDQRAADREPVQCRRAQLAHGDHVAAALHLPVLQQQIRADGEDHAHASQNAKIPPAHQMRVRLIADRARVDPLGRHTEAAAQQAEDRRGIGCGAFGRGRLARGHAVDEGLHQMLHDRLEHVGGKIQHPVNERRSRHLPDNHAHQRRKREKQQKAQPRRRKHLHRGQKGRHAESRADRPQEKRRHQRRHGAQQQSRQIVGQKQRPPPDRQGGIEIRAAGPEQPGKQHPGEQTAVDKRHDRRAGHRILQNRPLRLHEKVLCAHRHAAAVAVQPQRQQQLIQAEQPPDRRGPPQGAAEDRTVKA